MKDPKARDPRWYLKALYRDREIGLWTDPDPWEKYQMQVVEARTKVLTAKKNAFIQSPKKI